MNVRIQIGNNPTTQSDWIPLQLAVYCCVVVSMAVVPESCLLIVVLTKEADVQSADALLGHGAVVGAVRGPPDNGVIAIPYHLGAAYVV